MNYNFTAEEINLIAACDTGTLSSTLELLEDMAALIDRTMEKLRSFTEAEYAGMTWDAAEEEPNE